MIERSFREMEDSRRIVMMRARETASCEGAGRIVDSSGEIAMPPGSNAFRGDKSLDLQTVPLKSNMSIFRQFVHERELKRRRDGKNLKQRPFFGAVKVFATLMIEIDSFEAFVQKRLRMIKKNWEHLTEFYFIEDAPATNNSIENYYSTSLKTYMKATQD